MLEKLIYSTFLLFLLTAQIHAQEIFRLNATEVNSLLKNEDALRNSLLIDARDSLMYQSGHLKNAINFDAFQPDITILLNSVLKQDSLIVYCTNQRRSERIIDVLTELGYKGKIIYMIDGLTGWKSNKFEILIN